MDAERTVLVLGRSIKLSTGTAQRGGTGAVLICFYPVSQFEIVLVYVPFGNLT